MDEGVLYSNSLAKYAAVAPLGALRLPSFCASWRRGSLRAGRRSGGEGDTRTRSTRLPVLYRVSARSSRDLRRELPKVLDVVLAEAVDDLPIDSPIIGVHGDVPKPDRRSAGGTRASRRSAVDPSASPLLENSVSVGQEIGRIEEMLPQELSVRGIVT